MNARRIAALVLALLCLCASVTALGDSPSRGDLLHFIPTVITVTANKVTVEGYFVNLNTDVSVSNFRDFEMSVYHGDELIIKGDFGKINDFTIRPLRAQYQSFTFTGSHNLRSGTTVCTDSYYCSFSCTFTSTSAN